jgi:hypothetical protein
MKSRLLGIWHSNWCTENYNGELPLLPVFARTNNFLKRLTEGGKTLWISRCAASINPTTI